MEKRSERTRIQLRGDRAGAGWVGGCRDVPKLPYVDLRTEMSIELKETEIYKVFAVDLA